MRFFKNKLFQFFILHKEVEGVTDGGFYFTVLRVSWLLEGVGSGISIYIIGFIEGLGSVKDQMWHVLVPILWFCLSCPLFVEVSLAGDMDFVE